MRNFSSNKVIIIYIIELFHLVGTKLSQLVLSESENA